MSVTLHVLAAVACAALAIAALVVACARGQLQVERPDAASAHLAGLWISILLMLGAIYFARWI